MSKVMANACLANNNCSLEHIFSASHRYTVDKLPFGFKLAAYDWRTGECLYKMAHQAKQVIAMLEPCRKSSLITLGNGSEFLLSMLYDNRPDQCRIRVIDGITGALVQLLKCTPLSDSSGIDVLPLRRQGTSTRIVHAFRLIGQVPVRIPTGIGSEPPDLTTVQTFAYTEDGTRAPRSMICI